MTVRKYSSRSQQTTLSSPITATATTMTVVNGASIMGGKTLTGTQTYTVVIDPDTALEEIVDVTVYSSGNTLTITRGVDGPTPGTGFAHTAGALVRHMAIGRDYQEANDHNVASTGVHGITGSVVGTGGVQTLTDKTLTAPVLTTPVVTNLTLNDSSIVFEGSSADASETTLTVVNPTADRTLFLPDASDTLVGKATTDTLTNKTLTSPAINGGTISTATVSNGTIASGTLSTDLVAGGNKVTGLGTPTSTADAATKGYVDTQVSNLVASAPGTLDTLNELAEALGDDPNFATTMTTALASKLPLAGGTMTGAIAMGTNKITGLGTPTASDDATTKTYVDGILGSATVAATSATNAANSATAAATSATNAANSATAAASSATSASGSATTATTQAGIATTAATAASSSASSASASASTATTKASEASTSATNASASATTAQAWATQLSTPVSGSDYSAKYNANLAATSATNAASSASGASTSASAASTSATNAATSATNASGSASAASTSASNALTSANNAATSATAAATSATNAATSATQAAGYVVPSQTGNSGKYLTTDGTATSWGTVDALPSQTSNAGKLLGTDGTTAAWTSNIASPNFENGIKPKIGITLSNSPRGFSYYDGNALSTEFIASGIYFKGIQKVGNVWIGARLDFGSIYPHSSTDGITWTSLGYAGNGNNITNYSNNKVAHNGTCFIVVGGNYGGTAGIFKTTNITDYAQITNPPTFTNVNYIADTTVTSYNGYFLVPDFTGSSLFYSTDGDNWNTATLPTAARWTSTVYGAGKYVVVARDSQTAAYATTPGGTWTSITMPHSGYQSLIHDGTKFIAMGSSALATSTDGVTWTSQTFTESGTWNMAYSNGSYVATNIDSFTNYILVSTNGITWTQYYTPDGYFGHRSIGLVATQPASGTLKITGDSGASGQSLISTGAGIKWGAPAGATPTIAGTVYGQVDQNNTAVGVNALDTSILTNTYNIGIGQDALRYCTTGGGNVIASHSGTLITTGSGNVGIGSSALSSMQTGNYNTAIGNYAGGAAYGSDSTAVGYYAGRNGGTGNSSFGSQAGMYTAGTNNTFLGANAGKVPNAFFDYTNANITVIGANAIQSSKTVSNEITLGSPTIATIRAAVTSITSISDERDKTAIEPLTVGLDFVNELKPVQFEWNMRDGGKVGQLDAGFIAQDLVAAEDATGLADYLQLTMRENPEKLEATQGRLIPILVKAIQELSAEIKALKEGK